MADNQAQKTDTTPTPTSGTPETKKPEFKQGEKPTTTDTSKPDAAKTGTR